MRNGKSQKRIQLELVHCMKDITLKHCVKRSSAEQLIGVLCSAENNVCQNDSNIEIGIKQKAHNSCWHIFLC